MRTFTPLTLALLLGIFACAKPAFCQNQSQADSLKLILHKKATIPDSLRLFIVEKIAIYSSAPNDKLSYADTLLQLASKAKLTSYVISAHRHRGVALRLKGEIKKSLESLFLSAKMAHASNEPDPQVGAYLEIANTYTSNNQFKNALYYEKKAIDILRVHGNKKKLAINLLNTGFSYYTLGELDSALSLYNEAEPIFIEINLPIGKAYATGNRALVFWKKKDYLTAERDLLKAIELLEPLGDEFGIADYNNQLGRIYFEQNKSDQAILHTQKALALARTLGLKEQIRDASLLLSQLYTSRKKYQQALDYQSQYISYKDSIESREKTKEIADMRTAFEVNLREKEIDLLQQQQVLHRAYIALAIILLIVAIFIILYFRQRLVNTRLIAINERKLHDEKIEDLLSVQETKALQSMIQGRENERKRLAQELHNHFGSLLATIKVNLNGIDEKAIPNHRTITTLVDQACTDVRNLSHTLNMGISESFGLVPALKELTNHLQQASGLEVEFAASMCHGQMGSENEIIIYRIVQELVSNVLKHAQATKLSVQLTCFEEENLINILVQDNGKGFPSAEEHEPGEKDGIGIASLKQMVADRQGEIKFDSNPMSGTTVIIDLPIGNEKNEVD